MTPTIVVIANVLVLLSMPLIIFNLVRTGHYLKHMPGSEPVSRRRWCSLCTKRKDMGPLWRALTRWDSSS